MGGVFCVYVMKMYSLDLTKMYLYYYYDVDTPNEEQIDPFQLENRTMAFLHDPEVSSPSMHLVFLPVQPE